MAGKGKKAGIVLALSGVGVLAAYPYHAGFTGGLLTAGFTAATVGGLADWFAVEALFRKPLGVPYRTEVIARNRQRIFTLLADTVQHDLLQADNIRIHLKNYDLIAALLRLAETESSRRQLRRALYRLLRDLLRPEGGVAGQGGALLRDLAKSWRVAPLIIAWLKKLTASGQDELIISWLLGKAAEWCTSPVLAKALSGWAETALKAYGKGGAMREIAVSLADLEPKVLGSWAQQELQRLLNALQDQSHPWRLAWRKKRSDWLEEKEHDEIFLAKLEGWKEKMLDSAELEKRTDAFLGKERQTVWLMRRIYGWLEDQQNALRSDTGRREVLNAQGRELFLSWLERNHAEIGGTVLENLQRFSDADLVDLIESRAGEDLQMIRINGAVVGGLAGMALYLINQLF